MGVSYPKGHTQFLQNVLIMPEGDESYFLITYMFRCFKYQIYLSYNPCQLRYKDSYKTEDGIRVITKLPNSKQSSKGKVKTHKYINRQNQTTTGKL